ncbi:hypothetical protein PR048_006676, partial [Dryococelus australis]
MLPRMTTYCASHNARCFREGQPLALEVTLAASSAAAPQSAGELLETSSTSSGPRLLASLRFQSPAGSLRIFACGNRAGRCRWSAGFLGDLRFPPSLHSGAAPLSSRSPSSDLKTSMLKAVQISSLTQHRVDKCPETKWRDGSFDADVPILLLAVRGSDRGPHVSLTTACCCDSSLLAGTAAWRASYQALIDEQRAASVLACSAVVRGVSHCYGVCNNTSTRLKRERERSRELSTAAAIRKQAAGQFANKRKNCKRPPYVWPPRSRDPLSPHPADDQDGPKNGVMSSVSRHSDRKQARRDEAIVASEQWSAPHWQSSGPGIVTRSADEARWALTRGSRQTGTQLSDTASEASREGKRIRTSYEVTYNSRADIHVKVSLDGFHRASPAEPGQGKLSPARRCHFQLRSSRRSAKFHRACDVIRKGAKECRTFPRCRLSVTQQSAGFPGSSSNTQQTDMATGHVMSPKSAMLQRAVPTAGCTVWTMRAPHQGRSCQGWEDTIDFKRVYTEITFAIGSEFIRHILDDSMPIANLQSNNKRIPYCQMRDNTGAIANEQTSEVRLYRRLRGLVYRCCGLAFSHKKYDISRSLVERQPSARVRVRDQDARERYGRQHHPRLAPHRSYVQGVQCFRQTNRHPTHGLLTRDAEYYEVQRAARKQHDGASSIRLLITYASLFKAQMDLGAAETHASLNNSWRLVIGVVRGYLPPALSLSDDLWPARTGESFSELYNPKETVAIS